jgi:hypothetical protein
MAGVIAAVEDLFFGAKILETAKRMNVRLISSAHRKLAERRDSRPALVLTWCGLGRWAIRQVKADQLKDCALASSPWRTSRWPPPGRLRSVARCLHGTATSCALTRLPELKNLGSFRGARTITATTRRGILP